MVDWAGIALKSLRKDGKAIAEDLRDGTKGVISQGTGGLFGGTQGINGGGEGVGGVQRRPTAAEAAQQVRGGVNNMTQNVLNRFEQGRTQTPNLAATLESAPGRILGAILPSQATINRLTGGAAALTATVGGVADRVQEALADDKKPGVYTEQGPDGNPVTVDTVAIEGRVSAPPVAAPPERSWWERFTGATSAAVTTATNTATAAVASVTAAAAIAATPAPEAPPTPAIATAVSTSSPAASSGQGFVLVTPAEHAADLAAQAAAIQVTAPAVAPASTVAAGPVVTTSVDPATQFAAAAAPAAAPVKPSITAGLDATIAQAQENKEDAGKYERARAQILANYGPSNG